MSTDINAQLRQAAAVGRPDEEIKSLISQGAAIDSQDEITGRTALHNALAAGHSATANTLLDMHADRTLKDKNDDTAMDILIQWINHKATELSGTGAGANPDAANHSYKKIKEELQPHKVLLKRLAFGLDNSILDLSQTDKEQAQKHVDELRRSVENPTSEKPGSLLQ